jgi:hypothetical protein
MSIDLKNFVSREVVITLRNGGVRTVKLERYEYSLDYPYLIEVTCYSRSGRVIIDKECPMDIVDIRLVDEGRLVDEVEPNYREVAEELYSAIKGSPFSITSEQCQAMKNYESLTKPKMIFVDKLVFDRYVYGDGNFALFDGNWYYCSRNEILRVRDIALMDKLNAAFKENHE